MYYELPISFSDAALGTSVEVPSIDGGKSKIKIPAGTQHGKQFRLKGKGMPVLRRSVLEIFILEWSLKFLHRFQKAKRDIGGI